MKLLAPAVIIAMLGCAPAFAQNYQGYNQGMQNGSGFNGIQNMMGQRRHRHRHHHHHRSMMQGMNGNGFNNNGFNGGQFNGR